jgi:hypothetical protein
VTTGRWNQKGKENKMKNVPTGKERERREERRKSERARKREWAFFSRGGRERG